MRHLSGIYISGKFNTRLTKKADLSAYFAAMSMLPNELLQMAYWF